MWNEGTIGIPVADGSTSIIHFWVKNVDIPSEDRIRLGRWKNHKAQHET